MSEKALRFFWIMRRLILVNFICFPIFLPVLLWFYLAVTSYIQSIFFPGQYLSLLPGISYFSAWFLWLPQTVFYFLFAASLILSGPFLLALFHFAVKIQTGEHVWVSDLFSTAWKWKTRGVLFSICAVIFVHLCVWTLFLSFTGASVYLLAARLISLIFLLLLFFQFPYLCMQLLSVDLSIKQSLNNARILARLFLPRGLLLLLLTVGFLWAALYQFPVLGWFALPGIAMSLGVYVQVLICHPVLEKHVFRELHSEDE